MPSQLTRENLHGVWAAIPTPFDAHGRLDAGAFTENVVRLAEHGVHGIYTTGSDGEFFAVELDEFEVLAQALERGIAGFDIPTAMGVTWMSTAGTTARLRIAADHGIQGAHVGHPLYMEMTRPELDVFWDDCAAAVPQGFGLIHYNQARLPNVFSAQDYRHFVDRIPGLIGTKFALSDSSLFVESARAVPEIAHLCGDTDFTPMMMLGARGICSWFTSVNPAYMVAWYEDCVAGRWDAAIERQLRMLAFNRLKKQVFGAGARAAVINKAMLSAIGFLIGSHEVRRPYLSVPTASLVTFRQRALAEFPDLVGDNRPTTAA